MRQIARDAEQGGFEAMWVCDHFFLDANSTKTNCLEAWTLLMLADEPPLRSSGFGFYDPAGAVSVMGFGNTSTDVFSDWSFLGY